MDVISGVRDHTVCVFEWMMCGTIGLVCLQQTAVMEFNRTRHEGEEKNH